MSLADSITGKKSMSINELFRRLTEQEEEFLNDIKTTIRGATQEISQEIKRITNKPTEERYEEHKGRPEFPTEQYGNPFDSESESEGKQNREQGGAKSVSGVHVGDRQA